jgi:uncharacterized protein (DUF2345 family)
MLPKSRLILRMYRHATARVGKFTHTQHATLYNNRFVQISSGQDIGVAAGGAVSITTTGNLRTDSATIEVSSSTSDVVLDAPQSSVSITSTTTHITANGAQFTAGKGGIKYVVDDGIGQVLTMHNNHVFCVAC